MNIRIRDVSASDLPSLLVLNEAAVPNVNSIPLETLD